MKPTIEFTTNTQELEQAFTQVLNLLEKYDGDILPLNVDAERAFKISRKLRDLDEEVFEDGGNAVITSQTTAVLHHLLDDLRNDTQSCAMYGLQVASELGKRLVS